MIKTFAQISEDLKNKVYSPLYFLYGDEHFYIDYLADIFENKILDESEKEFNLHVLYGNEINYENIIANARRIPMMANNQLIIVREAQNISDKNTTDWEKYLENPVKSTIIVFCFKDKPDKRKKIFKLWDKNGIVFESNKIKDYQLPKWIISHTKELGYKIEEKAANLLAESIGNDLSRIHNELTKIIINIHQNEIINSQHIEKYIGISREYNVFELNNAIGNKDFKKALLICNNFAQNPKEYRIGLILNSLFNFFQQILKYHYVTKTTKPTNQTIYEILNIDNNPYVLKMIEEKAKNYPVGKLIKIFSFIREYDAMSKGINNNTSNDSELLKEFIIKIAHL